MVSSRSGHLVFQNWRFPAPAGVQIQPTENLRYVTQIVIRVHAGFWPECYQESAEIGPRPEGLFLYFLGSNPAEIQPGRPIYGPEAILRNMK